MGYVKKWEKLILSLQFRFVSIPKCDKTKIFADHSTTVVCKAKILGSKSVFLGFLRVVDRIFSRSSRFGEAEDLKNLVGIIQEQ